MREDPSLHPQDLSLLRATHSGLLRHDAAEESTGCLSVCNDRWHGSGEYADNSDGLCTFRPNYKLNGFPYNGGIYPHGI